MRYGIVSDIHSNLEALQAVMQACRQQNVQGILCLGDTVGYGASPQECLAILKKVKAVSVAGNHDWAVSGKLDASYFPKDGKEAIVWTRTKISFEEISFINNLNLIYQNDNFIIVHSTPCKPEIFNYLNTVEKAAKAFTVMKQSLCFIGHTHVPQVYAKRDNDVMETNILEFEVNRQYQYIVNVGSVGQPRDGNPMASYCIYDTDMQMVELKRIQYDIESAQKKIIEAGFPSSLAHRLVEGH